MSKTLNQLVCLMSCNSDKQFSLRSPPFMGSLSKVITNRKRTGGDSMSKQEKIDFILKRLGDRMTKSYLETKSDQFINQLYEVESRNDDRLIDEMMFSF